MEFRTDNNILYKYQSGFCKNHSTDTSLSYLIDKMLTGFDSSLLIGMILNDFQKLFTLQFFTFYIFLSFSSHSIVCFQ